MKELSKRLRNLFALCARADCALILLTVLLSVLLMLRFGVPGAGGSPAIENVVSSEPAVTEPAQLDPLPPAGPPLRFMMYNVHNYFVPGEKSRSRYVNRAKSLKARNAVADVIAEVAPEVVGLIEIGGEKALEDLCERLRERGLEYPYTYVLERRGEDRALALLSVHPIVSNDSVADVGLFGSQKRKMLRGILDVTIGLEDGRRFRIVGAHLKSRVGTDAAAADSLRRREARTLAMYLHEQQQRIPHVPVLVYGDWNDGPGDASLSVLGRGVGQRSGLTRLNPQDSQGNCWTLYFEDGREYFTFDQVFVNSVLKQRMGRRPKCGIADSSATATASDHRPVWCELR